MTITINNDICNKNELTMNELLAILIIRTGEDVAKLFQSLLDKDIIVKDMFNNYLVTQRWDDVVSTILLDSDKSREPPERIESLALKLMEVFPKEKKTGTCHYFRGNKKDVTLKLKKFFKIYGTYTDEQIINAAKKYVESFNGNYSYMRILKYFIWKDEKKINEEGKAYIEETSDLASWIENEGQSEYNNEWTAELR